MLITPASLRLPHGPPLPRRFSRLFHPPLLLRRAHLRLSRQPTFGPIVNTDLWGKRNRLRFSNVFGSLPVTFSAVTVALQEYSGNLVDGTITPVTFGGKKSVTIPPGQEIFSDGIRLS